MDAAHRRAQALVLEALVDRLCETLTHRLVAYMAGVDNTQIVRLWQHGVRPSVEQEQRLRTAYQIVTLLRDYEGEDTVRAWFMGMNPFLDDKSVAEAIHDGQFSEALGAASAFIAGSYA